AEVEAPQVVAAGGLDMGPLNIDAGLQVVRSEHFAQVIADGVNRIAIGVREIGRGAGVNSTGGLAAEIDGGNAVGIVVGVRIPLRHVAHLRPFHGVRIRVVEVPVNVAGGEAGFVYQGRRKHLGDVNQIAVAVPVDE